MPSTIEPVPVRLPSNVTFPNDGEGVDRASTLEAGTQLCNGVEYVSRLVDKFDHGGTVGTVGNFIWSSTGFLIFNNVTIPPPGNPIGIPDGATSAGRIRAPKAAVVSPTAAGTYVFDRQTVDHVFNIASATGVIWQIGNSAPAPGECIRFVNMSITPIPLQDPLGSLIVTLAYVPNGTYAITMCFNPSGGTGATWQPIDYTVKG